MISVDYKHQLFEKFVIVGKMAVRMFEMFGM